MSATMPASDQDVLDRLLRAEQAARSGRHGEADGICRDVLRERPGLPAAMALRGTAAGLAGDVAAGIALMAPAVAAEPGNAVWRATLCDLYRLACRMDEALAEGREALQLQPRHAGFLVTLGKTHADRGEFDDALAHFLAALSVEPENASAHLGIGQILLARGEWRPGWIEYEWRNKLDQAQGRIPRMNAPTWNGMAHPTGRILLIGDQGFGDSFQFARYVPLVAARCSEVLLGCSEELAPLLARMPGVGRVFSGWADIPSFTSWCLLSSLPFVLGTEEATIPATVPYLAAAADRRAAWSGRLASMPPGRRVGIVWSGRPTHPNDLRRSVPLARFLGLAGVPGVALVSLQRDRSEAEAASLAQAGVLDVADALTDFAETAALVEGLDLVVTVDSAVGHLAGALGVPVWVLSPMPADWRWLLGRPDSPWYPTMRLFRQAVPGAWDPVFADALAALREWAA